MNQQQIEADYREEQLRQMREQTKASRAARERKLKQGVGKLLTDLYTL